MRKRLLTYSLAVAMAVTMAVPQTVILPASATQVQAADENAEMKATPIVKNVAFSTMDDQDCIQFDELMKYADDDEIAAYTSSMNKVIVNEKDSEIYYGNDQKKDGNYYDLSWSTGLSIFKGEIKDGENTILIKANGYKDKKIVIDVNLADKKVSLVSQTDVENSGETVIDKNSLINAISAAGGCEEPEDAKDEKWVALQDALKKAMEVRDNDSSTQEEINQAANDLFTAIEAYQKKDDGIQNPTEDGVYTLAYSTEDSTAGSMIGSTIDSKMKLTVENGKMKISVLNIAMQDFLIDLSVGSGDTYNLAKIKDYTTKNDDTFKEYTVEINDITKDVKVAALVSAMGGQASDKGNWSKYRTAEIKISSVKKGWSGYESDRTEQENADTLVMNALIKNYPEIDENENGIIDDDEWNNLPSSIDLSNEGLTDISLLKKLPSKVTSIDLSYNNIKEIPEGLLDGKTELTEIVFNGNKISKLPKDLFKDTKNIENIYMSSMKLSKVEKHVFENLSKLNILDLQNNEISEVEEGVFDGLTNMTQLGLDGNELTNLPDDVFKSLKSLTFLGLSENEFVKVPKAVEEVSNVESLYLDWNNIQSVDNIDYAKLSKLKLLNFAWNEITSLPSGMLAQNKNLESVDFYDNRITSVSADMFPKTADGLVKLDLVLNEMKVVDPEVSKLTQGNNKQYPQKTVLNFKASQSGDKTVKWNQDLGILDLMFWREETNSDKKAEIKDLSGYMELIQDTYGGKDIIDILNDQNFDWDIITKVQKKNADGTYTTVSEDSTSEVADVLKGEFKVDANGVYRVKKTIQYGTSKVKQFGFSVYTNDVEVKDQIPVTPSKPTTEKPTTEAPSATTVVNKVTEAVKAKLSKVTNLKVKNKKKRKAVITWKKVKNASGYQIYRATKKNGKFKKVKTVKGNRVVKYTNTKLKKNKKYYYKVRAYRTVKGKKVYGAFSVKKSIFVKK